jgi:hypothetical protein
MNPTAGATARYSKSAGTSSARLRILGSLFGLRLLVLTQFRRLGLDRRSNSGVSMRIRALLVACLVVAASLIAVPAQAAPATVYIYKVYFDSPGSDSGSNSSLNAEYVVIRNGDNVSHSVSGWTVRDRADHRYTFPDGFRLGAGKQAIIHTGDGTSYTTSASTHLYWGREWNVWNNAGDKVILRRGDGSLKDTCSYSGAGSKKYC